jgi:hypothetical protein
MRLHPNATKTRSHEPCGETQFARQSNSRYSARTHARTHTSRARDACSRGSRSPVLEIALSRRQSARGTHTSAHSCGPNYPWPRRTEVVAAHTRRTPLAALAALAARPRLHTRARTRAAGKDDHNIRKLISDTPWKTESHELTPPPPGPVSASASASAFPASPRTCEHMMRAFVLRTYPPQVLF